MTRSRMWTAGTALVVVVVLAMGWFLLIEPKRATAAELRTTAADTEAANASTRAQIRQLELEYKQVPAQRAEIAAIKRQIPDQPLEPALIRQVTKIANDADVDLGSITPSAMIAVPGAEGVQYIPTTITVGGDFSKLKSFLDGLEENQRAFLVEGFNIEPNSGEELKGELEMVVTSRVFVAIDAAGAAASSATTPGSASAPTAAAGSTATPTAGAQSGAPVG